MKNFTPLTVEWLTGIVSLARNDSLARNNLRYKGIDPEAISPFLFLQRHGR